jgi:hypothetical protein
VSDEWSTSPDVGWKYPFEFGEEEDEEEGGEMGNRCYCGVTLGFVRCCTSWNFYHNECGGLICSAPAWGKGVGR